MKVLVLGANGMAGHMISNFLSRNGVSVDNLARNANIFSDTIILDVRNYVELQRLIDGTNYQYIINCVGILNESANNNPYLATQVNALLPHSLVELTKGSTTKVIHLSTDCVFSGRSGPYYFDSEKTGATVYDQSKSLGEIISSKHLTLRNSIIGPELNEDGIGLFHWFMTSQEASVAGYTDVFWSGVTTLELAKVILRLLFDFKTGVIQLSNNLPIAKFDLLAKINDCFVKNKSLVPVENGYSNKALIANSDLTIPSYDQMLLELKGWIDTNANLYSY